MRIAELALPHRPIHVPLRSMACYSHNICVHQVLHALRFHIYADRTDSSHRLVVSIGHEQLHPAVHAEPMRPVEGRLLHPSIHVPLSALADGAELHPLASSQKHPVAPAIGDHDAADAPAENGDGVRTVQGHCRRVLAWQRLLRERERLIKHRAARLIQSIRTSSLALHRHLQVICFLGLEAPALAERRREHGNSLADKIREAVPPLSLQH
mmetsp:Transcript_31558/g.100937  ORF Transcript_31558/g.100937 Transcript_31558/m.100937 type:complete len:211 (-) Transcript_31558:277-909(-)